MPTNSIFEPKVDSVLSPKVDSVFQTNPLLDRTALERQGAIPAIAASLLAGAGVGGVTGDVKMGIGTGAGGLLGTLGALALANAAGANISDPNKLMYGLGGAGVGSIAGALLTRYLASKKKEEEED